MGGFASLAISRKPLSFWQFAAKRALDIAGASLGLLLLSPVLVAIAVAIKLDSPGPVLFRQQRYGFNLNRFGIYKFRTMPEESCQAEFRQAVQDDPRVTPLGRWLRRLNLDELPQLLNVVLGDMSLVGPRPHPIGLDDHFNPRLLLFARRYNVLPGMTGWAQVNGFRGVTDEDWKMQERLQHDLYYVDHWTLALDLKILALTVLSMRSFRNAV